jgi:hypothetical protein
MANITEATPIRDLMALRVTFLLLIAGLLAPPKAILAQESTVEQLQELQELRNESRGGAATCAGN